MKKVRIQSGPKHYRDVEVPESWAEAHAMLMEAAHPRYNASGGDAHRNSVAGRVVLGMFWPEAPNPTIAMNWFLRSMCERKI